MGRSKKSYQKKSLSHGRPPTAQKPPASLSSTASRDIIRSHHQLHKALHQALEDGDNDKARTVGEQIEAAGGLKLYQLASITGQSVDRGGDTSKQLMIWLRDDPRISNSQDGMLKMLEVGALSLTNACSKSGLFDMTRIDLNSQHPDILQQDFMEMPCPGDKDRFDIVSLSLVLNYVPDPAERGEMLRRTCNFLKPPTEDTDSTTGETNQPLLPSLFFVLPKPCVTNSRYLTEDHLSEIMAGLGYTQARKKLTAKLHYSLWRYNPSHASKSPKAAKTLLNPGGNRNNFHIILR